MKLGCLISSVIACVSLAQAQSNPITVTLNGHSQEYSLSSTNFEFAFSGTIDIAGLGSASYGGGFPAFDPFGLRSITTAEGPILINFGGSVLEAYFAVAAGALIPSLGVPPNIGLMLIGGGTGEFAGATGRISLIAQSETMAGPQGNFTWTGTGCWTGPVPFAAFTTELEITGTPASGFELGGAFMLGGGATPINPVTQSVLLKVGTYLVTIPAGSFQAGFSGSFNYEGVIAGARLETRITPMGANAYRIHVEASDVNLAGLTNPVPVTLAFIGNNAGATTATAEFEREQ